MFDTMAYKLEVLTLSVSDIDRAVSFYSRQMGFVLDVDYHPAGNFRVVQLTPPGSACSIQIGVGLTDATPGSARTTYLVVTDIEATHRDLTARGVDIGAILHKSPIDDWHGGTEPGVDPQRRDYASLANFVDPDGNGWVLQEIGYQWPGGGPRP